jgi:hypothetical protein
MSVVKLFTAVDKKNVGLIPFSAMQAILRKYIALSLSVFELGLLKSNYRGNLDPDLCRYTDLYSDAMTASVEVDGGVEGAAADSTSRADGGDSSMDYSGTSSSRRRSSGFGISGGGAANHAAEPDEDLIDLLSCRSNVVQKQQPKRQRSDLKSRKFLRQLNWQTPLQMSVTLAKLAADYQFVGDMANAEALYQHSIALANAVHETAETSASLGLPVKPPKRDMNFPASESHFLSSQELSTFGSAGIDRGDLGGYRLGGHATSLGGLGHRLANIDQKLQAARNDISNASAKISANHLSGPVAVSSDNRYGSRREIQYGPINYGKETSLEARDKGDLGIAFSPTLVPQRQSFENKITEIYQAGDESGVADRATENNSNAKGHQKQIPPSLPFVTGIREISGDEVVVTTRSAGFHPTSSSLEAAMNGILKTAMTEEGVHSSFTHERRASSAGANDPQHASQFIFRGNNRYNHLREASAESRTGIVQASLDRPPANEIVRPLNRTKRQISGIGRLFRDYSTDERGTKAHAKAGTLDGSLYAFRGDIPGYEEEKEGPSDDGGGFTI